MFFFRENVERRHFDMISIYIYFSYEYEKHTYIYRVFKRVVCVVRRTYDR